MAYSNTVMSSKSETYQSVQEMVVRESAQNYRSFQRGKKRRPESQSKLEKIFSEETDPNKQHPHLADSEGFN
jgi:hypothetical protein